MIKLLAVVSLIVSMSLFAANNTIQYHSQNGKFPYKSIQLTKINASHMEFQYCTDERDETHPGDECYKPILLTQNPNQIDTYSFAFKGEAITSVQIITPEHIVLTANDNVFDHSGDKDIFKLNFYALSASEEQISK